MAEAGRGSRAYPGEVCIRESTAYRRRVALTAGATVGAVLVPVGLVLSLLSRDWSVLGLCVFAAALVSVSSFVGQGHNEVFVGARGIRRVSRDCDLIATWNALQAVEVRVPGNRIVVFTLDTTGLVVERLTRGHSNAAEAMLRNPPQGFELRLERVAADALMAKVSQHRSDVKGLAEWARVSRPG